MENHLTRPPTWRAGRVALALLLALAAVLSAPMAARAASTINVNTTADENGTGAGCSLREALASADTNTNVGGCTGSGGGVPFTINVPAGTYTLTVDELRVGDDTNTNTSIVGAGAGVVEHSATYAARLATAAGITGPISREWVRKAADISVEYGMARHVFDQTSLVEHYRIARRVFGESFDRAPGNVRGAITSLVFNRGGSMRGDGRREMRAIRDVCLPAGNWDCVASELRSMKRIWKGSDIEGGMEGLALLLDLPPDMTERGFSACGRQWPRQRPGASALT